MACYWSGRQSSNYADRRDSNRYIIFPDDINAENGELGFCETIFQAIETALDILDAIDLAFLALDLAKKIKAFIKLLRLLLQEYRHDPNKYRKVLKDLIIQLRQLIQELVIEKVKDTVKAVVIDQIINILETIIGRLEDLTGIGCTLLNFAFIHPIDNQQYATLCSVGRDGIEGWLVNNITSPFGLIKWKSTDLNYDRIILSRKRILTRIFDEVCTCIEFGDPPPFTPTPTPTNTCIPCKFTQVAVYDLECREIIESTIAPVIYKLNQNGEEIPVSIIDMVDCTENPDILDLLTCTLTTCTPTTPTSSVTTESSTSLPGDLSCIKPGTEHCYIEWLQDFRKRYPDLPSTGYIVTYDTVDLLQGSPEDIIRYSGYRKGIRKDRRPSYIGQSINEFYYNQYVTWITVYGQYYGHYDEHHWLNFSTDYILWNVYQAPYFREACIPYGFSGYRIERQIKYDIVWLAGISKHENEWSITHVLKVTSYPRIVPIGCISPDTTPTFNPTHTPTPTSTYTHTPTVTPSNSNDPECNFQYFWNENTRELCISNGSDAPMLVIISSESSPPIQFQINPNNTRCTMLEVDVSVAIYSRDGKECWYKNL